MPLRSIHVVANGRISLFFMAVLLYLYIYRYSYRYIYINIEISIVISHNFFIHSSINGHLGCFHVLAIVNNAAIIWGYRYLFESVLISLGSSPRSGITRSYGSSIFNFLRTFHTVFYSGCTSLQSHQQFTRVPFSPHLRQHLSSLVFLMVAILTGVRWSLTEVLLICISLMTNDVEHLHVPVGLMYIFSGKMSIQVFCLFLNCFIWILLLSCMSSLYILDINLLSDIWFANIFSLSIGCLFTLLIC